VLESTEASNLNKTVALSSKCKGQRCHILLLMTDWTFTNKLAIICIGSTWIIIPALYSIFQTKKEKRERGISSFFHRFIFDPANIILHILSLSSLIVYRGL